MHYRKQCDGLHWHNEPGISTVSAFNKSIYPDHMYEGAEFEIKDWNVKPYKSLILYHSIMTHRVTELVHGEKLSMVVWLPKQTKK